MASDKPSGPPGPGAHAEGGQALTPEERAEYERLRRYAQVRHRRLRKAGASVLLAVALLLAPLAVVTAWLDDTIADTDQYVETVAPLASEPAVQDAVIDRLTRRVVAEVDVEAVTAQLTEVLKEAGAPPQVADAAAALDGPLRSAVTAVAQRTITGVVTSDAFGQAWVAANRRAHDEVMNVLTGEREGALRAAGDTVQLDLGVVVDDVRQRLVDAGFDTAAAIPDSERTITLFQTEELSKAQDAMRLLDIVGTWLPVLTVALAALAVCTAPGHRVMLLITATGVGVMMVLLLVALAVMRRVYLDSVPPSALPSDAAAVIFDTFVRFLRNSTRTLLVVAVITAVAAWLYGPGRLARGVRGVARRGTTATGEALSRAGVRTGTTGRRMAAHQAWITGSVIGAGVLALVLWNHPTVGAVILVVGLVLLVSALTAVLAAAAGPAPPATEGEAGRAVP
ncbi:hypothetical protein [Streptomyces sp. S.PNR 29]|uniref:hypothetical protein n=1 Tax=Streptomyces sp. S.PNR 29 TaxID=2973805 RepID=UPI0025B10850|nr:hypothetical protein [Streptomyces sp. S.PNR 29]MDN0197387.1 hypothetical protein [Streptomyces sp. S.PNR 29]